MNPDKIRRFLRSIATIPSTLIQIHQAQLALLDKLASIEMTALGNSLQFASDRELIASRSAGILKGAAIGEFKHEHLIVLGSGPSLLSIDTDTLSLMRTTPVLAMNRYLNFWELIGIWPKYVFLADSLGVGTKVFKDQIQMLSKSSLKHPTYLLEEFYVTLAPLWLDCIFFRRDSRHGTDAEWADELTSSLFFQRGSLSSLMNLISIMKLARRVTLLGVDLNRPGAFFDLLRPHKPHLFNSWDDEASKLGVHATAIDVNGWVGNIIDSFDVIIREFGQRGIELYCGQAQSGLVKSGKVPFRAVTD